MPTDPEDDYDVLLLELAADETRAYATDRMLTPAEAAAAESERLLTLELERLKRMNPDYDDSESDDPSKTTKAPRQSKMTATYGPDDIFDGFDLAGSSSSEEEYSDVSEDSEGNAEDGPAEDVFETASTASKLVKQLRKVEIDRIKKAAVDQHAQQASLTAQGELPFTFAVPDTVEDLQALLATKTVTGEPQAVIQKTILERMLVCNHPSLNSGNLVRVEQMYELLTDLLIKWGHQSQVRELSEMNNLTGSLYAISQLMPVYAARSALTRIGALLQALQEAEQQEQEQSGHALGGWPRAGHLLWLQSLSNVFPVTDFHHPIVSAALLLLCRCLSFGFVTSLRLASCAVFCAASVFNWLLPTRRYAPEPIHALLKIVHTYFSAGTDPASSPVVVLSLLSNPISKAAAKQYASAGADCHRPLSWATLVTPDCTQSLQCDVARLTVISGVLRLLSRFVNLWDNKNAFESLVQPIRLQLQQCMQLKARQKILLPSSIWDQITTLTSLLDRRTTEIEKVRLPLRWQVHKPIALKTFRPRFREDGEYTLRNDSHDPDRERAQLKRLQKRVKSETKAATRELKKDALFLEQQRSVKRQREETKKKEILGKAISFIQTQQHEDREEMRRKELEKKNKKQRR
ncbi:MAG: hypothetical protein Q8P67_23380 [archaeon]|nr:hypothetical protein [archaeon]